jgi:hypothetical protein
MTQPTMSYVDNDSKILLHDDHNKLARIGIAAWPLSSGESFEETLENYLIRFGISRKIIRKFLK